MAKAFRGDIQGLRAVAVLLVVVYHSGVSVLSGGYVGVDVFFVISGFLITSHIWSEISASGHLRFATFYARRARRILPASLTVLVLSVVAMFIWMPPLQWSPTLTAAAATAFYVPNVLFWYQGTDYLAETVPSLFQHYWSLGIEEQFYLLWPLVLVLVFRWTRRSFRGLVAAVSVVVTVSFIASIVVTGTSQPAAFFLLPTRAWELGVGGLLALLVTSSPRWLAARWVGLLGWVGLALIGVAAFAYTAATPFPSWYAAVPVLGTALVILSGSGGSTGWAPVAALSIRPAQFLGKISYSLYLVHWPLLVIPQEAVGYNHPLPTWATLLLGAAAVPIAWLCWRFVEEPGRTGRFLASARPRRSLVAALAGSAVILAGCVAADSLTRGVPLHTDRPAAEVALTTAPSGTGYVPDNLEPSLRGAEADNPEIYANGCHQSYTGNDVTGCLVGTNPAAPLVALFGDSHAAQWYPALSELADEGRIRLQVNTKSSCPSADIPRPDYPGCDSWRDGSIAHIAAMSPAVVLLGNYAFEQSQRGHENGQDVSWGQAIEGTIERIPTDLDVVVLADTPAGSAAPSICLAGELTAAQSCAFPKDTALHEDIRESEAGLGDGYVDVTPLMCNASDCPAIIGNDLVYRDAHHMTATFSRSLAPELGEMIEPYLSDDTPASG
ncbi:MULTISPECIES: acyltransferase family protein [Microbacterium]|uniref:Acyltransferase n=1 Tax=Microbacterium hominis TaxID=162426 RepID=A0A2K9DQH1_9MICO|nr:MULTISPECIES: acyltransferase family protein [Microbacterium]AUG30648.1 acyltransferase [Microbacterium hominis]